MPSGIQPENSCFFWTEVSRINIKILQNSRLIKWVNTDFSTECLELTLRYCRFKINQKGKRRLQYETCQLIQLQIKKKLISDN